MSVVRSVRFLPSLAILLACSDDGPLSTEPNDLSANSTDLSVNSTVDFGDPPVSGFLEISTNDEGWQYELDIAGDKSIDATGFVQGTVRVPYTFESPGVHPIVALLSRGSVSKTMTRFIIVNDLAAFAPPTIAPVQPEDETLEFEGIAVSETDDMVYLGEAGQLRIIGVSSIDLTARNVYQSDPEDRGFLEGFALTPSERKLFVVDKRENVQGFLLPQLDRVVDLRDVGETQHFILAVSETEFWTGNPGIAHLSESGQILASVGGEANVWHFDVSDDVVILHTGGGRLKDKLLSSRPSVVLTTYDLAVLWETELEADFVPAAIAFAPSGGRIYLMGTYDGDWVFSTLDRETGSILYEMRLGAAPHGSLHSGAANPVTEVLDGDYVAFPTTIGTFLVDTTIDLPVLRTPEPASLFCCDVAASGPQGKLYFANERLVALQFSP